MLVIVKSCDDFITRRILLFNSEMQFVILFNNVTLGKIVGNKLHHSVNSWNHITPAVWFTVMVLGIKRVKVTDVQFSAEHVVCDVECCIVAEYVHVGCAAKAPDVSPHHPPQTDYADPAQHTTVTRQDVVQHQLVFTLQLLLVPYRDYKRKLVILVNVNFVQILMAVCRT